MHRVDFALAHTPIRGWVPVLNPRKDTATVAPLSGFSLIRWT
jgi:hypothetical protein